MDSMAFVLLASSLIAQQADPATAFDRDAVVDASHVAVVEDPLASVTAPTDAYIGQNYQALYHQSEGYYNEFYRYFAAREASKGRWERAATLFEISARYGDKYSQHRLSLFHWHGVGVAKDRVTAYIWADLAAERGYKSLLAIREKMWSEMTPEEQAVVPERGQRMYAAYGDEVAIRKFRGLFARQRFVHNAYAAQNGLGRIDRLSPKKYLELERNLWNRPIVTVGELEPADEDSERKSPAAEMP